MISCEICKYWEFKSLIYTESHLFLNYQNEKNIGNFFSSKIECPLSCGRECCKSENIELLQSNFPIEYYQEIAQKATDLHNYNDNLYIQALIAETKLGDHGLLNAFLEDVSFNLVLDGQKLKYYEDKILRHDLNKDESLIYLKLNQKHQRRRFTRQWHEILGNFIQVIAIGLQDQHTLMKLYRKFHDKTISESIINFLSAENLKILMEEEGKSEFYRIYNAKLDIDTKLTKLHESNLMPDEKIIFLYGLEPPEMNYLLKNVLQEDLPVPAILKALTVANNYNLLQQFRSHENPYVQAVSLFRIHQLDSRSRFHPDFKKDYRKVYEEAGLFLPIFGIEEFYYNIIMDNPDHLMVNYAIHMISSPKLLKKLQFHPELRELLRERLRYLNN